MISDFWIKIFICDENEAKSEANQAKSETMKLKAKQNQHEKVNNSSTILDEIDWYVRWMIINQKQSFLVQMFDLNVKTFFQSDYLMLIIRSVDRTYFKHRLRKISDSFLLNLFVREDDHRIKCKCIKNRIYNCRSFSTFRLNKKDVFDKNKNDNLQNLFDDFCQIFFLIHIEDSFFDYCYVTTCKKHRFIYRERSFRFISSFVAARRITTSSSRVCRLLLASYDSQSSMIIILRLSLFRIHLRT